jgi:acyl-CoA dehydrogenase
MAWDFSTDAEFQEKLDWVERFCQEKVEPLDFVFPHAVRWPDPVVKAYVRELQLQVKDQGLWAIFLGQDLGGPGFGQLKLALLNEVIGRYSGAPAMFGAAAPDTGNMEILAAYGTGEQKKRWLEPLLNQDMFSAYSMTEPQGGSDPDLFKTHAERDGDEWVINGEKWFTSAGRVADLLFVMCTNGMFVVPRTTPGVEIMPEPRNHNHIVYRDVRVPLDHLLGPENGAKVLAQRRLGGGRIHHAMRTIAQCKLAFDMMCERALSRESHGRIIAEHQMVQEKIAESYAAIKMLRLFVLETAWKIDQTSTLEARTDISAVKFTMAKVLREVSYNALHILGSLGTTDLTPIQAMYASAPTMGIADGVDEVHKATVARRVLHGYRPHEGYWPTEYIPAKREEAWRRMRPVLDARPDLARAAEKYASRRLAGRTYELSCSSLARSRRTVFWILPVDVLGSSPNSKRLGTLYRASRSLAYSVSAPASTSSFRSATKATGTSPQRSCGIPTTALSTTEGWLSSTCSTSTEAMFSPPEMMMSLLRSRIST